MAKNIVLPPNSRYLSTNVYEDAKGNTFFGPWQPLNLPLDATDSFYLVREGVQARLDLLAYDIYGDSGLWWVIANYNNVINPFLLEAGETLRIPSRARVTAALGA